MKFRMLSLQESIIDDLIAKYSDRIPPDILSELMSINIKKPYKYLPWILKQYVKLGKKINTKTIMKFVKGAESGLLKKKDINQYNLDELEDAVKTIKLPEEEKEEIKQEAEMIINDDRITILIPRTHRCSVEYGSPNWCTSYKSPLNWKKYSPYLGNHVELFYIIPKFKVSDDFKKVALSIYTRRINPEQFNEKILLELKEKFAEMVSGNFTDPIMGQRVVVDLSDVKKAEDFAYFYDGYYYLIEGYNYYNKLRKAETIINALELEDYLGLLFGNI